MTDRISAIALDQEDVRAAAAGDAEAFERLYLRHEDHLRRMFVALVRDPFLAEELVQDTFVTAWRKLSTLRHATAIGGWLRRIGTNLLHDRHRAERTDLVHQARSVEATEIRGREARTAERIDLERCIEALPARYRKPFVMHHVEGYTHAEIARALGVPVGTAKIHVHRATLLLRAALAA